MKVDEPTQNRLVRSLLMSVRYKDGKLDPTTTLQLFGRPLLAAEVAAFINVLRMTQFMSLPQAVSFMTQELDGEGGALAAIDRLRSVVDELFSAVQEKRTPLPARVRVVVRLDQHAS